MADWEVAVLCPEHKKNVYLIVEALDTTSAKGKVVGLTVHCPWEPPHDFIVKAEDVQAVASYPWKPRYGIISTTSAVPAPPFPYYVPKPPEELLYMSYPDRRQTQLRRARWWERAW